jgi:hypothetical protein
MGYYALQRYSSFSDQIGTLMVKTGPEWAIPPSAA